MAEQPQQIIAHGYDTVAERYAELERDVLWPRLGWLDEAAAGNPGHHLVDAVELAS